MSFEEVVEQILSNRQDLTREELLEMIQKKKEGSQEFFTDDAAARIVALELGVEILKKPLQLKVLFRDLVSGLNDVTVTGSVVDIYPPQTFTRQDQTEGKFARLVIRDKSGILRVVLWNEKTDSVEAGKVKLGNTVKVLHGYVREGLNGKPELHVGSRGKLQVSPPTVTKEARPTTFTKIGELRPNMRDVHVLARVMQVSDIREFKRSETEAGHVSTLLIKDGTGYARLNLWEDRAFVSGDIKPGDAILVEGAYVRERFGKLSLNVETSGALTLNPQVPETDALPLYEQERTKIAEMKEEGGPVTVEGVVASTPTMREVVTSKDEKVVVVSFDLQDDTGMIRVSAWRGLAETAKGLTVGTAVEIKNAYVRRGFGDQLELTSRMFTSIKRVPKSEELLS